VLLDDHALARATLDHLEPSYTAQGDIHALAFVSYHRAWSHVQCQELDEALARIAQHRTLASQLNDMNEVHRGLELESAAWESAGRWPEALAAYKALHAAYRQNLQEQAEEHARGMAVALQTDRALREANQDALTHLANRRALDSAMAQLPARLSTQAHALILIDMDYFKAINDHFGHAAGDEALVALAEVMRLACRTSDLPARLGGDEFAVLVQGNAAAAGQLAQRIRASFQRWRPSLPDMPTPSLSIGVAECSALPGVNTPSAWLAAADRALYAAKAAGRNTVCSAPA
jgi:diguanylate cyclase (GGDEF)-like protein